MRAVDWFRTIRNGNGKQRLREAVVSRARLLPHLFSDPADGQVELHCPDYVLPTADREEVEIVERIFRAYRAMRSAMMSSKPLYRPSSLWESQLATAYRPLSLSLETDDLGLFHHFLTNFGTWKMYLGVENTTFVWENSRGLLRRRYLKNSVFLRQVRIWQWYYGGRKSLKLLSYPLHGNQSGAYVDGSFVGVGSAGAEINGSLLAGLVGDIDRPVVADLGAGYGKFDYFCLRDRERFCFIDFDLPETVCLAAYYLMKTWPERKVLLFGEDEFHGDSHREYDLIFLPSWEIEKLADDSVDLFINKNSLGEMTSVAASNYVQHIARTARYFFHMNHDNFPNVFTGGDCGLLGFEYPVPSDRFRLLNRGPEMFHMLHRGPEISRLSGGGGLDLGMDIFCYLYERRQ